MVRAFLEGRKTVTRRVVKGTDTDWDFVGIEERPYGRRVKADGTEYPKELDWPHAVFSAGNGYYDYPMIKAPYRPGDILYVRETWANLLYRDRHTRYVYKATDTYPFGETMVLQFWWHPSIHMPREAARIFLRVTDVRVERLQDITPEQIDAEGCREYGYSVESGELMPSSPCYFSIVWDSTITQADRAVYGWEANPWVWVIEFEWCKKPEEV